MTKPSPVPKQSPVLTPHALTPATGEYHEKHWDERPEAIQQNVLRKVTAYVLLARSLDSTAGFALNQSLKLFFMKLGWSNFGSNSMKVTYDAISQFATIFVGYLADEKFGKLKTLFGFVTLDLVGFTLLVIASLPSMVANVQVAKVLFVGGVFAGVALSHGALEWLFMSFGADQYAPHGPPRDKALFFSAILWCSSIGITISYAVFPSLSSHGLGAISAKYGFTANYAFGLIAVTSIVAVIFLTRKRYVVLPPTKGSVSKVISTTFQFAKSNFRASLIVLGTVFFLIAFAFNVLAALLADHGQTGFTLSKVAGGLVLAGMVLWISVGRDTSFLNTAKETSGGRVDDQFVDDIKRVVRILPFVAFNMIWYMCQNQRGNNQTIIQQTDVRLGHGPHASQIPGPTVQLFNPLSTVLYIPITEKIIFPWYERKFGKPPSRYGQILLGYGIVTFSMVWTGLFEIYRRSRPLLTYETADGATSFIYNTDGKQPMSDIPWFAALPQYLLTSLAGVFIYIPSYDIYYSEVPASMRATSVALGAFSTAMGNTLLSAVIIVWKKYVPANLNNGHMEYLHFTLAAMMVVNMVFFVIVSKKTRLGMLSAAEGPLDSERKEGEATV
jgi:solute carrier family 15 (peptide/histidine transporter), member 3/4